MRHGGLEEIDLGDVVSAKLLKVLVSSSLINLGLVTPAIFALSRGRLHARN